MLLEDVTRHRVAKQMAEDHFVKRAEEIRKRKEQIGDQVFGLIYTEEQQELLESLPDFVCATIAQVYFTAGEDQRYILPLSRPRRKAAKEEAGPDLELKVSEILEEVTKVLEDSDKLEADKQVIFLNVYRRLQFFPTEESLNDWPEALALLPEDRNQVEIPPTVEEIRKDLNHG